MGIKEIFKKCWIWLNKNGTAITVIISLLIFFGLNNFNLKNIPNFYISLSIEGKILFVLIFNTLLTIILFSISMAKKKTEYHPSLG